VLVTDLTLRVNLERECLQAEKLAAMDNVVAGIAHELNNPMTAILGYAELLLSSESDPKRKQRAGLIAEEADRCAKIIANMLTFTRSYGKKLELANINSLLEEVVSLRAYQMRVDHVRIHAFYDSGIPPIMAQPDAIRRLFLNLVHNAHQALLEVPETRRDLWITTTLNDGGMHIQIADNGPGIPETVRYKIFDPFFSTRPFGEGMGLGLSVAYGIAHEHKGRIWMEPRVGGGTNINVELPVPGSVS
jgi:two-component system NtrC family sensor kinase